MKVSFVIPAYNAAKTICRCLESVIAQTDDDWEAVIVNDGSQDNTYELLQLYAKKDARIIALTQKNQGPGMARNYAMKHTCGDYIAFLDSDDYIEPYYVKSVKEKIRAELLDVVILDNYYEKQSGELIRMEALSKFKGLSKADLIAVQMTGKMPWGGCRKVIRASILKENEIEYSCDAVGEEALFSFRVFHHATKIGFLGLPVLHYVDYPTSQSKKGADDPWGCVVERLYNYLAENHMLDSYRKQINSFAYTALVVSAYRISVNHSFFKARSLIVKKTKEVQQKYKYDCDKDCLETRVKLLLPFLRLKLTLPIVLIAKLKKRIKATT